MEIEAKYAISDGAVFDALLELRALGQYGLRPTGERYLVVGFAGERQRHGFHPHVCLAAEAATDFRRRHFELRDVHAEQRGADVAKREVALRGDPQFALAIGTNARETRVRLDVTLVRLFCFVAALDDDVGLREAGFDVAVPELGHL